MRLSPQCGHFQEMAGITVSATSFGGGASLMTPTRSQFPQSTKKYHWSRSTNNNRNPLTAPQPAHVRALLTFLQERREMWQPGDHTETSLVFGLCSDVGRSWTRQR